MDQDKIGKFIKEVRIKDKLSQEKFGEKYGVTYQAVSKWENGKNLPDISILKEICKDYNKDINELLNDNNNFFNRTSINFINKQKQNKNEKIPIINSNSLNNKNLDKLKNDLSNKKIVNKKNDKNLEKKLDEINERMYYKVINYHPSRLRTPWLV